MWYFYMAMIAMAIIAAVVLMMCLFVQLRKKWAYKKVRSLSYEEKIRDLDDALDPFGYRYVPKEDLISSGMYPWQREMGFCRQYDEAGPAMFMVFDCEPIYFNYEGKRWLLELWKGQYGCTTGAEIGLYVNESAQENVSPQKLFYSCASDEDRLQMSFRLRKNSQIIMERSELHWWLTGFLVGEYSTPEELFMEVSIGFPNMDMKKAFYRGALRAGYKAEEIYGSGCSISLLFDKPRTQQPSRYSRGYLRHICRQNGKNCRRYMQVTHLFESTLDKISYIGYCAPLMYRRIIHIGTKRSRRRMKKYGRRKVRG